MHDGIHVAADSILLKDDLKRTGFKKLIKVNNMIVGGCGNAEELKLMLCYAEKHTPESASIEDIMLFMRDFSKYKEFITGSADIDNEYILVYGYTLFSIDGFFVQKVEDYTAIGQGESYALAALHLGHSVEEAVKCAADLCCSVAAPIEVYRIYLQDLIERNTFKCNQQ